MIFNMNIEDPNIEDTNTAYVDGGCLQSASSAVQPTAVLTYSFFFLQKAGL